MPNNTHFRNENVNLKKSKQAAAILGACHTGMHYAGLENLFWLSMLKDNLFLKFLLSKIQGEPAPISRQSHFKKLAQSRGTVHLKNLAQSRGTVHLKNLAQSRGIVPL